MASNKKTVKRVIGATASIVFMYFCGMYYMIDVDEPGRVIYDK